MMNEHDQLKQYYPEIPIADSTDNLTFSDAIGNKSDATATTVNSTQSEMAYVKGILTIVLTLITEDYIMKIHVPSIIDVDNTMMPQVTFYDKKLKTPVASGDIVAGTFKLARYRANSRTEILAATAWTKSTGKIKDSRIAAAANWATDDLAVWEPQSDTTIEVNGVVVTPIIPELQIPIGDISTLETKLSEIQADLGDFTGQTNLQTLLAALAIPDTAGKGLFVELATDRLDSASYGLSALKDLIDAIQTDVTALNDISTAQVNTEVDNALDTIVPASPTAGSINDALSKVAGGNSFDKETDSLEAISDSVSTGTLEIEAGAGSTTTKIIDTSALTQATADWFRNAMLVSINGTNSGQARRIIAFNTGSTSVDVYPAFLAAPAADDDFLLVSSWQPNILDQQPDVAVNTTVGTASVDIFDLNIANITYMVNNLILKFADPGVETITVTLTELVSNTPLPVDTFVVNSTNYTSYFSLYDMFSRNHLAGDDIQVSMVASANNAYVVLGQYQYAETYTG